MITYLVSFTESERINKRKYEYTDYNNVILLADSEKSRKAYSPDVRHDKLLSSVNIKFEKEGKWSAEEMLRFWDRSEKEKERRKKASFRELLNLKSINTRKLRYLFNLYKTDLYTIDKSVLKNIFEELMTWSSISPSPYSNSFYNTHDKSWDYTPEGSYRISDHWNFYSRGKRHCIISGTNEDEKINGWMLCQFVGGKYQIVKTF